MGSANGVLLLNKTNTSKIINYIDTYVEVAIHYITLNSRPNGYSRQFHNSCDPSRENIPAM